jgi:hypothetical protein
MSILCALIIISDQVGKKKSQYRRLEQRNNQLLSIRDLRKDIAFGKYDELLKPVRGFEIYLGNCPAGLSFVLLPFGPVEIAPVGRRYPPCFRRLAAFSEHLGLYNIEYLFRIDIATNITFTFIVISLFNFPFEIFYGVNRVSVIDQVAASVKDNKLIKHLEYFGGGLMNYNEQQFTLPGKLLQQVKDIFRIP